MDAPAVVEEFFARMNAHDPARVAVEAESFATHPEGKRYNNRYHDVFEIAAGRIRACREYYDTLHTAEVMLGASVSL